MASLALIEAMASIIRPSTMLKASSVGFQTVARRSIATFPRATRVNANATRLPKTFRRGYAESKEAPAGVPVGPVVNNTQQAPRRSRFRALKWAWRATYLTVIGGAVYLAYGVYELRHPDEQPVADPNKQTLVILGKLQFSLHYNKCN